jgi:hypothetical protein
MFCSVAVVTLIGASAGATVREAFTIGTPDTPGWGPIVLAVVDHDRARPTGGYYCPPLGPDEREEDAICAGASLVEGPADIVRYLSPRPDGWRDPGPRPRIRFIGAHAVRWVDSGRQIAILEQTDKGYLWRVWSAGVDRGWACFPEQVVREFRLTSRLGLRARGDESHCVDLARLG